MPKTVCLQLLALLAILSWNFADAKTLEESDDEVLTLEKRDDALKVLQKAEAADEEDLTKRDPENQEEEEDEEEVWTKRDPENQEEEKEEEEVVEKRDPESQEEEEEVLTKRDPENQEEEKEEEEVVEKRDPENQEEEKEREIEYQDEQTEQENNFDEVLEKREPEEETQEETAVEEKREDAEVSMDSESEASQVEDLETRAVQARFTLVDYRGRRVNGERQGLLLFNGGTVCDDHFSWNSAHAICRTMGYLQARRYRSGLVYGSFQSRKRIGLDNVICSSTHWAACRSTPNHNCNHREDILLTCRGTGFKLVNSRGSLVTGQREGLLTYQHGTVCDDYFNMNSAHAICRVMGYSSAVRWRNGLRYGMEQSHRRITMDDVRCRYSYWNYCSYRSSHNCRHYEDVLLTCRPGGSHPPGHRFTLVDWRGAAAARGCEGLLLHNGGTVCDDYFNMNAAHAICRVMGFRSATRYRNGLAYGAMQTRKRITMDDVRCSSRTWSRCRFSTRHNCGHGEDILLTCHA